MLPRRPVAQVGQGRRHELPVHTQRAFTVLAIGPDLQIHRIDRQAQFHHLVGSIRDPLAAAERKHPRCVRGLRVPDVPTGDDFIGDDIDLGQPTHRETRDQCALFGVHACLAMPLSQDDDDAGQCRLTRVASIDLQDRPVKDQRLLCRIDRLRGGVDNESISSLQHLLGDFAYELVCSIDGRRCRGLRCASRE